MIDRALVNHRRSCLVLSLRTLHRIFGPYRMCISRGEFYILWPRNGRRRRVCTLVVASGESLPLLTMAVSYPLARIWPFKDQCWRWM